MAGQTFSAVAAQRDTSAAARDRALLGRLRESTQTHDARLECAGGSLTAHRCILAAASPTLEAHFYGGMAPAPQPDGMVLKQLYGRDVSRTRGEHRPRTDHSNPF